MTDANPGGSASSNRTPMIVLAYLGVLALIPLLVEKQDKEVQWHAKNGLVLFFVELVLFVGYWITMAVIAGVLGNFGVLVNCLSVLFVPLPVLAIGILHLACIIRGVQGHRLVIPGLSEFADRF